MRRAALASTLALAACGRAPAAHVRDGASGAPTAAAERGAWRLHPRAAKGLRAAIDVDETTRLYAGDDGVRWLVDLRTGRAAASPFRLDLDVAAIARGAGWVFLDATGRARVADAAIGPVVAARDAPAPLAHVAASGAHVVGATRAGALVRSDDAGATWRDTGAPAARWISVAVGADGTALALGAPEALWLSRADGDAARIDETPFGARVVGVDAAGRVAAEGPTATRHAGGAGTRDDVPLDDGAPPFVGDVRPEASATAVAEGRAQLDDDRYVEAVRDEAGAWSLLVGAPGEPLARRALAPAVDCVEVALARRAGRIALACASGPGAGAHVRVLVGDDDGAALVDDGARFVRDGARLALALGEDGAALLLGACRPSRGACERAAPLARELVAGRPRWSRVDASPSAPLAAAWDRSGRVAWVVAEPAADGALGVFRRARGAWLPASARVAIDGDALVRVSVAPRAAGGVALVVRGRDGARLVALDEAGALASVAVPPDPTAELGIAGARVLAVAARPPRAFVSDDEGATFRAIAAPPLSPRAPAPRVACASRGCVVGDDASFDFTAPRLPDGPSAHEADREAAPSAKLATPLACRFGDTPWTALAGLAAAPSVEDAARGDLDWSSFAVEGARVTALHARGGTRPGVARVPLIAGRDDRAVLVSHQVEGVVALAWDRRTTGADAALLDGAELAWDDRVRDRVRRVRLRGLGPWFAATPAGGADCAELHGATLSIVDGGVVLARPDRGVFFVSAGGAEWTGPWPRFPSADLRGRPLGARGDFVRVAGAVTAFGVAADASVLFLGAPGAGDAPAAALGLGAATGEVGVTYLGPRAVIAVERDDGAFVLPLDPRGALARDEARAAPVASDLPDPPRACGADDLRATARVVARARPGTRRAVLVADADGTPWRALLTDRATLAGSPGAPCLAAIEATAIDDPAGGARTSVLVVAADPPRAWAFRADASGVDARAATCRFAPGAELPRALREPP